MRVGILTMYHENYSYGGLLQAFALQQEVTRMGYECQQVAYDYNERFREEYVNKTGLINHLKRFRRELINYKFQCILHRNNDITKKKYRVFMNFIPHSTICNSKTVSDIINDYDAFIVGGDQVWNMDYCDKNFFLPMIDKKRKISYSASVGKDNLSEEEKEELINGVKSFGSISVREKSLQKVINTSTDIESQVVIDPVFLMTKSFWEEFKISCDINERYSLVYLLGNDTDERKSAIRLARRKGLKVVFIPYANVGYCKGEEKAGDIQVWSIGPREFLGLVSGADYIFTDSFHATAFSIIFEKNFLCFSRPNKDFSMNSRIDTLLEMSGLKDRYISLKHFKSIDLSDIDYIDCSKKVAIYCEQSRKWLETSLAQIREDRKK